MRMSLYLYWRDDQDLIALKAACGKNFLGVVRDCLSAYLSGEDYILPESKNGLPSYDNEMITLSFPEGKCRQIVDFLARQPKGQQSNAVKFVLRHYMNGFRDEGYYSSPLKKTGIRLRLSTGHDADLLGLYYQDPDAFAGRVLQAARAFVNGKKYVFHVPDGVTAVQGKDKKSCLVTIRFENKDDAVVQFLDEIQDGLREPALKNILRAALDRPLLCPEVEPGAAVKRRPQPERVAEPMQ